MTPSETDIQIAYIDWCRAQSDERRFAFHIPNEGKRSVVGHVIQGRMGLVAGASDVLVPAWRAGWNGLFMELKSAGERPTRDQVEFGENMISCGYAWAWSDDLDKAMAYTIEYMAGRILRRGAFMSQPER